MRIPMFKEVLYSHPGGLRREEPVIMTVSREDIHDLEDVLIKLINGTMTREGVIGSAAMSILGFAAEGMIAGFAGLASLAISMQGIIDMFKRDTWTRLLTKLVPLDRDLDRGEQIRINLSYALGDARSDIPLQYRNGMYVPYHAGDTDSQGRLYTVVNYPIVYVAIYALTDIKPAVINISKRKGTF